MENINISILGFLFNVGMHGYEIFKQISNKKGYGAIYSLKIGKLYAILNKFEENGFVTTDIQVDGNRPPKKVYAITEKGKKRFNIWMIEPIQHGREIRINLLLKIYFTKINSSFNLKSILINQIEECHRWLGNISNEIEFMEEDNNIGSLVLAFRKSQIEGYIQWLKWCKRSVTNG